MKKQVIVKKTYESIEQIEVDSDADRTTLMVKASEVEYGTPAWMKTEIFDALTEELLAEYHSTPETRAMSIEEIRARSAAAMEGKKE